MSITSISASTRSALARLEEICPGSAGETAGAVVSPPVRGFGQARDLDDVARMRRMHETSPLDVDPRVGEAVEEDQVAGLKVVPRYRTADAPEHGAVVGQADPDAAVDVHDEPGAVEAIRAGARPAVRGAEVAERDGNDARASHRLGLDVLRRVGQEPVLDEGGGELLRLGRAEARRLGCGGSRKRARQQDQREEGASEAHSEGSATQGRGNLSSLLRRWAVWSQPLDRHCDICRFLALFFFELFLGAAGVELAL